MFTTTRKEAILFHKQHLNLAIQNECESCHFIHLYESIT